jgi:hypothetical protein
MPRKSKGHGAETFHEGTAEKQEETDRAGFTLSRSIVWESIHRRPMLQQRTRIITV